MKKGSLEFFNGKGFYCFCDDYLYNNYCYVYDFTRKTESYLSSNYYDRMYSSEDHRDGVSSTILNDKYYAIGGTRKGYIEYLTEGTSMYADDAKPDIDEEYGPTEGCGVRMTDDSFMYIGQNGTLEYNIIENKIIKLPNPAEQRKMFGCALFKDFEAHYFT